MKLKNVGVKDLLITSLLQGTLKNLRFFKIMGIYYGIRVYEIRLMGPPLENDNNPCFRVLASIDSSEWKRQDFIKKLDEFLKNNRDKIPVDNYKKIFTESNSHQRLDYFIELKSRTWTTYDPNDNRIGYGYYQANYKTIVDQIEFCEKYDTSD
jgi:hypothetical protein